MAMFGVVKFNVNLDDIRVMEVFTKKCRSYQIHLGDNPLPSFVVEVALDEDGKPVGDGKITGRMDVLTAFAGGSVAPKMAELMGAAAVYAAYIAKEGVL